MCSEVLGKVFLSPDLPWLGALGLSLVYKLPDLD